MEPVEYVRGLRRRWRVLVAATLVGAVVAWFTSAALPQTTTEDDAKFAADVLILDARGNQFSERGGDPSDMSLETMATIVTLEEVSKHAADRLSSDLDPEDLAKDVEASADNDSQILTITATSPTARQAERTALAFAKGLQEYLQEQKHSGLRTQIRVLQRQIDELPEPTGGGRGDENSSVRLNLQSQISTLRADLAEPLGLPILEHGDAEEVASAGISAPSSRGMQVLLGALIGLLGGIALALVLERFDRRITNWRQAADHVDAPLLGEIPKVRRRRSISVMDSPTSRGADAFRLLASTALHDIQERAAIAAEGNGHTPSPTPVIAITSAVRSEGKSFISANLAAALGELGMRVTVISCDLRAPQLHRYLDVPRSPGLVDAIGSWDGKPGFHRIHLRTRVPNVSLIPSGSSTPRPASVLTSKEFPSVLEYARDESDIVLLDTPATLLSGDALTALQQAECVLLVARVGRTSVDALSRVSDTIARLGVSVAGVALNGSKGVTAGWHRTPYRISKEPETAAELASTGPEGS